MGEKTSIYDNSSLAGSRTQTAKQKRMHRIAEKIYRVDFSASMFRLRELIPECRDNPSLNKITVLEKAADYIQAIHDRYGLQMVHPDELVEHVTKLQRKIREQSHVIRRLEHRVYYEEVPSNTTGQGITL